MIRNLLAAVLILFCSVAFAITDEEIFRNFQFSFVNPGARATGMGNAFVALADDATAAEANPAGLTILNKPEVSFEYRNISYDQKALNSINSLSVPGEEIRIESFNDLEQLNRPSFFSVVYPFRGTTIAFSRQEAVRIQASIDELFHFQVPVDGDVLLVEAGALGNLDQTVVNYNFSVARKITPKFSIGGSLRFSHLDWTTDVENFMIFFGNRLDTFTTTIDETDNSLAFNVGAIYNLTPKILVGAVYKRNPRFEVQEVESGDFAQKPGPFTNVLKIPDTFGAGISIKPNSIITLSSDVVWIQYSDLIEGFEAGYNLATARYENDEIAYEIDDVYEFHIGAEFFVVLGDFPVALRNGYYRKPSNALVVTDTQGVLPFDRMVVETIFTNPEAENHITIGGGVVFTNFQVDFAVDKANSSTNFVLSSVYRF